MRLLFVVPKLTGGGAEFVAATWISALDDRGHEVTVCTTDALERPAGLDPRIGHRSLGSSRRRWAQIDTLRDAVQHARPEVCVSLQAHPNLVLLTAAARWRSGRHPAVVISERNLVSTGLRGASPTHRVKIRLAKLLYRRADHVLAISHPVAAELVSAFGVAPERCTVVPNPALAKLTAPESLGDRTPSVAADVLTVVLPCRLVEQKRPLVAVAVTARLREQGLDARLLVFGDGPLRDALEAEARRHGVPVTFAGWRERWFDECPEGSVVALPSRREGFGNVLVEAAGARVPVAAFSMALGVADAVVPGVTGYLAPRMTVASLADAVVRARECTFRGVSPWLRTFTADHSTSSLESLLRELAPL